MIASLRIPPRFQRYRLRFLTVAGRIFLRTTHSVNAWKLLFMSYFQRGFMVVVTGMHNFQHMPSACYVASFTLTGDIDQYWEFFRLIQPGSVPGATLTTYSFNKLVNLILILNTGNLYRVDLRPTAFCSHLCTATPTRKITVLTSKNVVSLKQACNLCLH